MNHFSKQTTSFVILFLIAAIATYGALRMNKKLQQELANQTNSSIQNKINQAHQTLNQKSNLETAFGPSVDTTDWQEYSDPTYNIRFKYPPAWKVATKQDDSQKAYLIVLTPPQKKQPITVYVTGNDYFAMDGIPTKNVTINGMSAVTANDILVGVKHNANYYTFDIGENLNLKTEFQGVVHTVAFNQ